MKVWLLLSLFAFLLIGFTVSQGFFSGKPGYKIKRNKVLYTYRKHYESPVLKVRRVAGAEVKSFRTLSQAYAKDEQQVYFEGVPLQNADPASFQMLAIDGLLDTDKNQVYYRGEILSKEANKFQGIGSLYYKDSHHIWMKRKDPEYHHLCRFILLTKDQVSSFELLDGGEQLARTNKQVFYQGKEITDVNPSKIKLLGAEYWKDAHWVFFQDKKVQEADLSSFTVLRYPYAKDSLQVFYQGKKIAEAVSTTFENLPLRSGEPSAYFRDQTHVYFKGKIVESADPSRFELIYFPNGAASLYAKDNQSVYYNGEKMPDTHPGTFRLDGAKR